MFYMVCHYCQSEYRITRRLSDSAQTDQAECKVCGKKLISWRKSKMMYKAKLKVKRNMHKNSKATHRFLNKNP
jgi:rRNA maturation endonuclease Nob1